LSGGLKSLVLASGNPGKHAELQSLLRPLGIHVLTQVELGVAEADEPHDSFLENALAKARHACIATGLPALADDSGLCVDALGGAPGVHSAYFAGRDGDRGERDARNNDKLLAEMRTKRDRRAHYECVLVLMRGADDPRPLVARAEWHGEIAPAARGDGGFGYDPLFEVGGLGCTAAELAPEEKNRISHRGQALRKMVELIARS